MARLVIDSGSEAGMVYQIGQTMLTIGRGTHCDISLVDKRVSREHVQVQYYRGSYLLQDLHSRNGTFINHEKLAGIHRLQEGDQIGVGGTAFSFELDESDSQIRKRDRERVRLEPDSAKHPQIETPAQWEITPMGESSAISREMLRDPLHRLRAIYSVSDSLRYENDINDLLWKIMDVIWTFVKPDRGVILIQNDNGDVGLSPALVRTAAESQEEIIISQGMVRRSMSERVGILMADAPSDEQFGDSNSVYAGQIRSAMCAPLVAAGTTLGVLYVDLQINQNSLVPSFTKDDLDLITGITLQAAMALQNARLHMEMSKHQRLEKELEIAREIQSSMLPKSYPKVDGLQFAAMCLPARQVGGDYFDFLKMPDNRIAIIVGDASGKGVPAAIMVSTVRAGLRAQARAAKAITTDAIVGALNSSVCLDGSQDDLVTLFMLLYDDKTRIIHYTNAGHVPGLIVRADGEVIRLGEGGLLLGVMEEATYVETEIQLLSDDIILLYSDGVTESSDLNDNMYGEERLSSLCKNLRAYDAEQIRENIYQDVLRFRESREQFDDLTIVVMKVQ